MRVGYVQFDCTFGDKEKNLTRAAHLIGQKQADLLVLPELFNSGYLFTSKQEVEQLSEAVPDGETTQFLERVARERQVYIVAGLPERAGEKIYNSAVCVGPKGYVGVYRKVHLFDREKMWFTPGEGPFEVFDIGLAKIGVMICFDWIFPEAARTLALKGADIICHPSNLVLPYCQDAMITRCIENRVYAITANRIGSEKRGGVTLNFTGKSQVVGPKGEILTRASADKERVGVVEIDSKHARDKNVTDANNIFKDRRPEVYELGR